MLPQQPQQNNKIKPEVRPATNGRVAPYSQQKQHPMIQRQLGTQQQNAITTIDMNKIGISEDKVINMFADDNIDIDADEDLNKILTDQRVSENNVARVDNNTMSIQPNRSDDRSQVQHSSEDTRNRTRNKKRSDGEYSVTSSRRKKTDSIVL
jgi:hypothetical protein